jgi:hypothetical protein
VNGAEIAWFVFSLLVILVPFTFCMWAVLGKLRLRLRTLFAITTIIALVYGLASYIARK